MDTLSPLLDTQIMMIGAQPMTLGGALILAAFLLSVLLLWLLTAFLGAHRRAREAADALRRQSEAGEARLNDVLKSQAEMQGRMQTMAELFGSRQSELNEAIQTRIDGLTQRIGQNLSDQTRSTQANLAQLQERLAVIDTAQTNIQKLAGDVVQLQSILANKQMRGAFGQSRMEAIIADGLPKGAYAFQPTLSNGNRPDCVIHMPNDSPSLVVDAKFPLEAYEALRVSEEPEAKKRAIAQFRRDIDTHLKAISEKYLIAGETHDTAFMFVPSEAIFAEIHEQHDALVQRAHRARVVIVSPSLLMLSVQVMQSVLKDIRMREQAHLIQKEVMMLLDDVGRLDDRVRKLQGHFGQAQKDVEDILISSGKVTKRGRQIETLDFSESRPAITDTPAATAPPATKAVGQLKLRIVDDEGAPD